MQWRDAWKVSKLAWSLNFIKIFPKVAQIGFLDAFEQKKIFFAKRASGRCKDISLKCYLEGVEKSGIGLSIRLHVFHGSYGFWLQVVAFRSLLMLFLLVLQLLTALRLNHKHFSLTLCLWDPFWNVSSLFLTFLVLSVPFWSVFHLSRISFLLTGPFWSVFCFPRGKFLSLKYPRA